MSLIVRRGLGLGLFRRMGEIVRWSRLVGSLCNLLSSYSALAPILTFASAFLLLSLSYSHTPASAFILLIQASILLSVVHDHPSYASVVHHSNGITLPFQRSISGL